LSLTLKVHCAGEEASYLHIADATGGNASWTQLSGAFTVPTCTLSELSLYVEGPAAGVNLYVDDVGVRQSCP
jgi:hypothetical protein